MEALFCRHSIRCHSASLVTVSNSGAPVLGTMTALSFVTTISYGFELTSKLTGRGHYDLMDAAASILGGLLSIGVLLLLKMPVLYGTCSSKGNSQ